jgi:PAS domain S-box-containing protein
MNGIQISGRAQRAGRWRERFANIVAFLAPLIIGAVVVLLTQQVRTTDHLNLEKERARERRTELFQLLSAHQDVETGGRGYVITGNEKFLEPYNKGSRRLLSVWQRLSEFGHGQSSEPDALLKLRELSNLKLAHTRATIETRRAGDQQGAEAKVMSGRGRVLMDEIREGIDQLLERQQNTIAERSANAERAVANLRYLTFALLATLAALLIAAWLALQHSLRSRDDAWTKLEDMALRQKAVLESAMDGIITINPSGSIESTNAATLRMFGYAPGELDRRDVGILLADQPPIGQVAEELRAFGMQNDADGTAVEILARRSDGMVFPTEVALTTTLLNEGLRYVAVIRDVTERKRNEQIKSDFVSTVTHELRTPLTSIAGALGLLKGGSAGVLPERVDRLITIAHDNANRMVRLVNDILDIQKIESGNMPFNLRELDLKAAVSSAIEENRSYAAKFGADIALSAPMTPMTVSADPDRLAQVLTNLLSNAAKFSPPDGTVQVTISRHDAFYRVTIADKGAGIPEDFRDQIFTKFAQADSTTNRANGGTGLGLSIVREIVERLDGHVSFDTETGKGTRFHVDLPVPDRAAELQTPAHPALLVCGNGAGKVLTQALRKAGYAVTYATNPDMAREAAARTKFAGIVVDMGLPDGVGIDIIQRLHEDTLNADTPVMAIGGEPGATELDGAGALILDWLRKPLDIPRLIGSVETARAAIDQQCPRILHVEDDPDVRRLVGMALENHCEIVVADSLTSARALLQEGEFDLAILDIGLRDGAGVELLPELRQGGDTPIPVIIFSAQNTDSESAGLVDANLTKARTPIAELIATVGRLVETHRERTSSE